MLLKAKHTPTLKTAFQCFFGFPGDTQQGKRKNTFSCVVRRDYVRPEGFEPSTPRAEIWYSIQLNYGRIL